MKDSPVNRLASHWPQESSTACAEEQSIGNLAKSFEQQVEEFMGEHPKLTVAAAAAMGVLLGWMVKRK